MELVLHIGDCKTGSSSIQHALANKLWSSETRLTYPSRRTHNTLAASVRGLKGAKPAKKSFGAVAEKLARAKDAEIAVLSAEHFEFADPVRLQNVLRKTMPDLADTARVVAYVRPHGEQVISRFVQRMKLGNFSGSQEAFHARLLRQKSLLYAPRFERWRKVFGDNFTLRPMIRNMLDQGDVVTDFFGFAFRGAAFELAPVPVRNAAVSVSDLALLDHLQTLLETLEDGALKGMRVTYGQRLIAAMETDPDPKADRPRLHRALAEKVAETYRADAASTDAAFFEGTPLSDALERIGEKAVDSPQSFRAEDHFSPEALRAARVSAQALIKTMVQAGINDRPAVKRQAAIAKRARRRAAELT